MSSKVESGVRQGGDWNVVLGCKTLRKTVKHSVVFMAKQDICFVAHDWAISGKEGRNQWVYELSVCSFLEARAGRCFDYKLKQN